MLTFEWNTIASHANGSSISIGILKYFFFFVRLFVCFAVTNSFIYFIVSLRFIHPLLYDQRNQQSRDDERKKKKNNRRGRMNGIKMASKHLMLYSKLMNKFRCVYFICWVFRTDIDSMYFFVVATFSSLCDNTSFSTDIVKFSMWRDDKDQTTPLFVSSSNQPINSNEFNLLKKRRWK